LPGRQIHRQILYLDVVARAEEKPASVEASARRVRAETKVPTLDPSSPARPEVHVGEHFIVQWVFQGVDIPGEWQLRRIKFQPAKRK
jgi:hypothetical protein